jgi:hypothetical protein
MGNNLCYISRSGTDILCIRYNNLIDRLHINNLNYKVFNQTSSFESLIEENLKKINNITNSEYYNKCNCFSEYPYYVEDNIISIVILFIIILCIILLFLYKFTNKY